MNKIKSPQPPFEKGGNTILRTLFQRGETRTHFSIYKALGLLIILGFIWGSGYSIARYAMTNGVPPLGYSFWQSLGPAILLIVFGAKHLREYLNPAFFPYFFICGLLGIAIPNSNMYFTAAHLPAGLLALLVNTVPLFVYPMACLFKQEHFSWKRLFAVLIGFTGIVYLILPTHSLSSLSEILDMNIWAWVTLISPFCFALCSVYIASRNKSMNIYAASMGMLLMSTLLLIPFVYFEQGFYSLMLPWDGPKWAVFLEIILSSVGYLLFFYLIRYAGSVYYSLTGGVVGITGIFWGYILFGETLNYNQIIAIFLILVAIGYMAYSSEKNKRSHDAVD